MTQNAYGSNLLFDKWNPSEITRSEGTGSLNIFYLFPFASVHVQSTNINYPVYTINGTSMKENFNDLGTLFDSQFLQMYSDGKKWLKTKLDQASIIYPELGQIDLEEHSYFNRKTGLNVKVDYNKLKVDRSNVSERNNIAKRIYDSLENVLDSEFGIENEELSPRILVPGIRIGNEKILSLSNGIYLVTESPFENEMGAGSLYMGVTTDENGKRQNYEQVLEFINSYFNKEFTEELVGIGKNGVVSIGLSGDGPSWKIDLSGIELLKRLENKELSRLLPFPE